MGTGELIIGVLGLVFGGGGAALVKVGLDWRSGRLAEERTAWTERDREARARRLLENALHCANRRLIDAGQRPIEWPDY